MNYTEIEAKVREATNDEAWGPTGICTKMDTLSIFNEILSLLCW